MPTLLEPPMTSLAEAMRPKRVPTPNEEQAIADVRDMAVEWDAGRLPLSSVRRQSSGRQRWLATRFTPPDHPAFRPMMRMFDALIRSDETEGRVMVTRHGLITEAMAAESETTIEHHDGQQVIVFPVRYPWKVKPDPDRGVAGVRADAIYRPASERKPVYGTFGAGLRQKPDEREKEWWEE